MDTGGREGPRKAVGADADADADAATDETAPTAGRIFRGLPRGCLGAGAMTARSPGSLRGRPLPLFSPGSMLKIEIR